MTRYGIIKTKQPEHPPRSLLVVPHKKKPLIVSRFGPNTLKNNEAEMQKIYSHPQTGEPITFRPATTSESISAVVYNFAEIAKPEIFDPGWLQAGRIIGTPELGVFTNTRETNPDNLRLLLDNARKVNGIYIVSDTIALAPYESFQRGVQEFGDFAVNPRTNGLARALEYSKGKKATNFAKIAGEENYNLGVNVRYFDPTSEPVERVAGLYSYRDADCDRLGVDGDGWDDDDGGYAFGVLNFVAEGDAPKR